MSFNEHYVHVDIDAIGVGTIWDKLEVMTFVLVVISCKAKKLCFDETMQPV